MLLADVGFIRRRHDVEHPAIVAAIQVQRANPELIARSGACTAEELANALRVQLGPVVGIEKNRHAGAGSDTGVLPFHSQRYRQPRRATIRRTTQMCSGRVKDRFLRGVQSPCRVD
jgi:hypothetical protein